MRHTTTIHYWGSEDLDSIIEDIRDHEHDGWHVHQIVPLPNAKTVGEVTITKSDMFVVYAKADS